MPLDLTLIDRGAAPDDEDADSAYVAAGLLNTWASEIQTLVNANETAIAGAVAKALFDANTILAANSDNTPAALTVAEQTLVGRITGGNIGALTATQVRTLLNVEDGADATDTDNVTAAGALMDSEVTNLAAVKAFDPTDYATAAQGALADSAVQPGDINSLAELNALLADATLGDASDFATAAQGATADAALPRAGGEMTGNITMAGPQTVDGRDLSADGSKLDGIESGADVTDTANVTAAGALMDSEVTNLAAVKAFDPADYATAAQGGLADTALQPADVLPAAWNVQAGTTYTIQASDAGKIIGFTNGSAVAVDLPDTLDQNFQCTVVQLGAGAVTVTPDTDTINGAGTGVSPAAQFKAMYLSQYAAGAWVAIL